MEFRRVLFRSLLDRLEQRIAGLLGEPVGILHDQDLPAPAHRGERGAAYQISDLVDTDREILGADQRHVGVRSCEHRAAGLASPATVLLALERAGEGVCGVGPARAWTPGDEEQIGRTAWRDRVGR